MKKHDRYFFALAYTYLGVSTTQLAMEPRDTDLSLFDVCAIERGRLF